MIDQVNNFIRFFSNDLPAKFFPKIVSSIQEINLQLLIKEFIWQNQN